MIFLSLLMLSQPASSDQYVVRHPHPSYVGVTYKIVCQSRFISIDSNYTESELMGAIRDIKIDGKMIEQSEVQKISSIINNHEVVNIYSLTRCGEGSDRLVMVEAEIFSRLKNEGSRRMTFWLSENGQISEVVREN